jgi:hypothetical protein
MGRGKARKGGRTACVAMDMGRMPKPRRESRASRRTWASRPCYDAGSHRSRRHGQVARCHERVMASGGASGPGADLADSPACDSLRA